MTRADWDVLWGIRGGSAANGKELMIIQLYFAFMGEHTRLGDKAGVLIHLRKFLEEHGTELTRAMDPERTFDFAEGNVTKVKRLLMFLKEETAEIASGYEIRILDVFASAILEGMQHAGIIQRVQDSEREDVTEELRACVRTQKVFQRLMQSFAF